MSISLVLDTFSKSLPVQKLKETLAQNQGKNTPSKIHIDGLIGSSLSMSIAYLFKTNDIPLLILLEDKEEAAYLYNDLQYLISEQEVLFYPASYRRPYQIEETNNANVVRRAEVLKRLCSKKKPTVIITYANAVFEKVISKKSIEKNTIKLHVGDQIDLDFLNETLFEYRFNRVDFVTQAGEFSVRGGIVDVFSYDNDDPYRIEFFGNEVDSIRSFDIETQLSIEPKKKISIVPNIDNKKQTEKRISFLEFINHNTWIISKNTGQIAHQIEEQFEKATEAFANLSSGIDQLQPQELFIQKKDFKEQLHGFTHIQTGNKSEIAVKELIHFQSSPQPSFNKKFDLLLEDLNLKKETGYTSYIFCSSEEQVHRLDDIFAELDPAFSYEPLVAPLHQGFVMEALKLCCYTDHQIFERYHKFKLKNNSNKRAALQLSELNNLENGDFVTHIDHGIGRFAGLQKIDVNGQQQEAIKLIYGERDILYVSIHSLHKISKYNGKDGTTPKLYKLGSNAWKKLKEKTKSRVKKIAFDLIKTYAKRKFKKGFACGADSYLQLELEASFIYEDTPDQSSVTSDIKADMESTQPMDRLVCGDVGFGKTEVAIRAAFKAVDNGKQVAVLVPTTILAFQHFRTFSKRLKDMPVRVDYLNRFRTAKERTQVLKDLEAGKIDIIVGTHQLVNNNVKFSDIGLLIVDEEQKFGVGVKDKLKSIKENIDVLTLTATPIPRTLQFSLMAARDLSVINTPPPNRVPIESEVIRFDEEVIRDAISYEIQRGGQVFFINNRIENIQEVAGMIQRLVPDAKVAIGHGQMEGKKLEKIMLNFMEGAFDVLVATTIIESGLDVTNANTIFINNANNFGLSDLHQMRGRVGRSNKKAFCYFITPAYHQMTTEARKRIEAIEQFTALGSGFNIAMKDLEIRGAGDILGGEQSGFINDIGFDTYQKIMNEAIEELKTTEFAELFEEELAKRPSWEVKDIQLDTDFELLFPDHYINKTSERLKLYKQLNQLENSEELQRYKEQLADRFGPLPKEAEELIDSMKVKWISAHLGIEKIVLKQQKLLAYFIAEQDSKFYQSELFRGILIYVQQHPKECQLKEKETRNGLRLMLTFTGIDSIEKALKVLDPFKALFTYTNTK